VDLWGKTSEVSEKRHNLLVLHTVIPDFSASFSNLGGLDWSGQPTNAHSAPCSVLGSPEWHTVARLGRTA
jgi:hypothetical protein